jgi:hypothetical protein
VSELLLLANVNVQHFLVLSHQLVPVKFDFILKLDCTKFVVPCFYHQRELLLIIDNRHVIMSWACVLRVCIPRVSGFVSLNERITVQRFVFERLVWRCVFRKWDRVRILLSTFFRILMRILRRCTSVGRLLFCIMNINLNLLITYKWFKAGCGGALLDDFC